MMTRWATELPLGCYPYRPATLAHATATAGFGSLNRCLDKIVLGNRKNGDPNQNFLENVFRVIERNGEVTLPVTNLHPHRWKIVTGIVVGVGAITALAAAFLR